MTGVIVTLTDMDTGEKFTFKSNRAACKFLGRAENYISQSKKNNVEIICDTHNERRFTFKLVSTTAKRSGRSIITDYHNRHAQLCCYCANCNSRKCSFIASCGVLPIEGWKADEDFVFNFYTKERIPTYMIHECPKFEPDAAIYKCKAELAEKDWKVLEPYMDMINEKHREHNRSLVAFKKDIGKIK